MYSLTVTNSDGTPRQVIGGRVITHGFADHNELRRALIHGYHVDPIQVRHCLEVLQSGGDGALYDLSIVHESDNDQSIVWTARVEKCS